MFKIFATRCKFSLSQKYDLSEIVFISKIFPSAYQIRMAGCKGLLIVDPQSNFDEFYIKIRPSMKKFECDDWTLDICDWSRASMNPNILFQFSKRKNHCSTNST